MFIPIHDKNPLKVVIFQIVTVTIIVLCVAVFVSQINSTGQLALVYGMIPSVLSNVHWLPPEVHAISAELTLVSYMFLHSSWMHLLGNMLFLWVFGDNIEDSMGHFRFIIFYLLCGIAAGLTHGIMESTSDLPLVGASGAIAGILGAYLMLHPRVKILVLLFSRLPVNLPAYVLIVIWILFQFYSVSIIEDNSHVAWWAHIGGFVAGVILIVPMRYKRVPLFDKGLEH